MLRRFGWRLSSSVCFGALQGRGLKLKPRILSPSILPIPGTGSVSHVADNVAAAAIGLTPAEVAAISHG